MNGPDAIDPAPRRPLSPREKWVASTLFALFAALLLVDLAKTASPTVWTVPFIMLSWIPLLALHEVGHALAAWAVGARVHRIVIGLGRDAYRFRLGETHVVLKRFPVEGFVESYPRGLRFARLKNAFVYFGGPGMELAVLGVLFGTVGPEQLLNQSESIGLLFVQSVAVAIGLGLFFTLVPHRTRDGHASDGLGILLSAILPRQFFADAAARPIVEDADRLIEAGEPARALAVVESGLSEAPDSFLLCAARAVCLAATGDGDGASEILDAMGRPKEHTSHRALELYLARARVGLEDPSPARLRDAELACDAALELRPEFLPYEVTLGAVLYERGRTAESIEVLGAALPRAGDSRERARCLGFLALAAHRVGNHDEARACLALLEELDASPRLVRRVRLETGGAQSEDLRDPD